MALSILLDTEQIVSQFPHGLLSHCLAINILAGSSWVARYSEEIRAVIHGSEEEYQNAVERLADVKRHQNIFLLKRATVR